MPEHFLPESSPANRDRPLHDIRLEHVLHAIKATGARSVLDLGCGSGALLTKLAASGAFDYLLGLEQSGLALMEARERLGAYLNQSEVAVRLRCGSYTESQPALKGYDAAAMVETIEHVEPGHLSRVESVVFTQMCPRWVFVTTPNREYNPLLDLEPGEFREADHKFEWDRARFRHWARGTASRNGYSVRFEGIGDVDPSLGPPSQMAVFHLETTASEPERPMVGAG